MAKKSLKTGNYTYIGLDIDTTGRRLIDEIVNIAAYTPDAQYSQHIMPLMNLNPGARVKHQVRVINVGCFRMLKSMQTYKVIKTKTEIAALLDFLDWLEEVNKNDGVIFVYHDQQKFTPFMVIEAMKKYRLMERFTKTVHSFVNGYDLASTTAAVSGDGLKYLLLAQNKKIQQEKLEMTPDTEEVFEGDATVRAKLSYEIVMLMAHGGEKKELDTSAMAALTNEFILEKAQPIDQELKEIGEQEECIKRQSSLRDMFRGYFQTSRYHRRRAVTFRRLLSEAKHDMDSLQVVWNEGKREAIAAKVKELEDLKEKEEDQEELTEIIDSFFDPEKKTVKPVVQRRESVGNGMPRNTRRRRGPRSTSMNNKENRGPRQDSRRRNRSSEKRFNNNNNNNMIDSRTGATMDPKTGAVRKDQMQQADANQNSVMVAAN